MQSMNENEQGMLAAGVIAVIAIVALFIGLAINAVVCWLVSSSLARIPAEHRKMEPGQVWLLMIPCWSIVWNFFVFQRVPESFQSYFASIGRQDVGDCGKQIGLWYAICGACSFVPLLNYLAGPAGLVLLILNLVKFNQLKSEIQG